MADVAFRSDDRAFLRPFGRGRVGGRGGFDRLAPRSEPVGDRPRGDTAGRPWSWPVVPARDSSANGPVAPSSTVPAVVALPRVATAAPSSAAEVDVAPPIRVFPSARLAAPTEGRRRGFAVIAAAATHLLCLSALLAMPADEPSGGGVVTEALEIAIVFAEDSVDAVAGASGSIAETPRETTVEPPEVEPAEVEPPPRPPVAVEEPVPDEPAAQTVASPPPPAEISPSAAPAAAETPVLATSQPADEAVPPPVQSPSPPASQAVTPAPVAPPAPSTPEAVPAPPVTPSRSQPTPPPPPIHSKVEPTPAPKPVRRETTKAKRPDGSKRRSVAAAATGSGPRDSLSGARSTGSAPAAGTGAHADWRAAVLAALARAKRYPNDARDRGLSGRAVVTFTLTRSGAVTGVALAASSGSAALDGATLAIPRRAAFPPMPPGGPDSRPFTAGVRYDLR